jgi:pimeloyl-ACP methyl ester carboxylesterase
MQPNKSVKAMLSFVTTLLLAYAALCLVLFIFQRQMIYFPTSEVSVEGVPHIVLDSGEARIKVWTLNPHQARAIIYFGGNAENVAYNVDDFRQMFPEHTVYLVNYRGYGGSSGSPNESALYADAVLAYDHFSKAHTSVAVMGRSVGSAVATYLASERDVRKLLLITPFDSAVSVGKRLYPFFPIGLILQDKLDSKSRAGRIGAKTMIVATKDDEIIPYAHTTALAEAFKKTHLQVVELREVGHNTIQLHPAYSKTVSEFMNR